MKTYLLLLILEAININSTYGFLKFPLNSSFAGETCNNGLNGVHSFDIPADSPNGPITFLHIQYDAARASPISSTAYHDYLNKIQTVSRVDNFRVWPCPQLPSPSIQSDCKNTFKMTDQQQAFSGYTSFDRGHMAPVNPYRFDFSAMDNTFYCVNNAPQEPYTNQQPWNTIEQTVLQNTNTGYVMTGLCEDDSGDGPTLTGIRVSSCYWKLVCKKTGTTTSVIGFIGENGLMEEGDTLARQQRTSDTTKVRSQAEVLRRVGHSSLIQKAWRDASKVLLFNRDSETAPNPEECVTQLELDEDEREKWTNYVAETEENIKNNPQFYQ